jgi:phenylacetate-CoA ligase
LIFKQSALAPHYQCILRKDGPMDALTVAVEARAGLAVDTPAAQAATAALAQDIKNFIGCSAKIDLRHEGGVERSVGKAKRVLDLRGN